MPHLRFPEPFTHRHPPVRSVNEIIEAHLSAQDEALVQIHALLAELGPSTNTASS